MQIPLVRVLLVVLLVFPMACNQTPHGDSSFKPAPVKLPRASAIYNLLSEGDIILRQGQGPFSTEIVRLMEEKNPVSHCGLIVRYENKLVVVQSISEELSGIDGLQVQDIQSFIDDTADSNLFIMRYKDTSVAAGMSAEALEILAKKIPFDHRYNLDDDSKMYCAELPYHCFKKLSSTGFFKFKKTDGPSLIKFDTFFQPAFFSKVYACRKITWIK